VLIILTVEVFLLPEYLRGRRRMRNFRFCFKGNKELLNQKKRSKELKLGQKILPERHNK
jgi:hypothetical protein